MEIKDTASSNHPTDNGCGFAGTLKNIQLVDLIQMCCLSASSLCMRVTKDKSQGTIFIIDGEIIHAACEEMVGEEAFYRILGWQAGSFESIEITMTPQRTIDKNYNYLIMEAARRVDEEPREESTPDKDATAVAEDDHADRTRVLIVDDSPMMRRILSGMLTTGNLAQVVGMAGNGKEAIALIDELSPDLVALDVNMPVMDGTSTIKHIMIKKPCPVVIMSNPGDGSFKTIFNFLELGAVDFMSKPTKSHDVLLQQQRILERIRLASTAKVSNFRISRIPKAKSCRPTDDPCQRLVIVISGPGGHPEQMSFLAELLPAMTDVDGAVLAMQSLPPAFSEPFAQYLMERCGCPASTISQETAIHSGRCYVGIQGLPFVIKMNGVGPIIERIVPDDGMVAIDRFLKTAASTFGRRLVVVLLSGADTGEHSGLRAVRENGGRIIIRNRKSSMVAEPLDGVAESGFVDAEVNAADLVKTVLEGFDLNQ